MVWYRFDKKRTTDDLLRLSAGWLKKHDYLRENSIINGRLSWKQHSEAYPPKETGSLNFSANFFGEKRHITLFYKYRDREYISLDIPIVCSYPYYGGRRYWFLCPRCGRKSTFLYGGKYFLCRRCQNLSYPTQQMGFWERMLARSRKYEKRVLKDGCRKPWVHQSTFEKYMDRSEDYEMRGLFAMCRVLKRLTGE